jgi:hypothetical protein
MNKFGIPKLFRSKEEKLLEKIETIKKEVSKFKDSNGFANYLGKNKILIFSYLNLGDGSSLPLNEEEKIYYNHWVFLSSKELADKLDFFKKIRPTIDPGIFRDMVYSQIHLVPRNGMNGEGENESRKAYFELLP